MTLEQQISKKALDLVNKQKLGSDGAEYRSLCEGFPSMLRTAGLAQSLAFLRAKGGIHGKVYGDLQSHFEGLELIAANRDLLEAVVDPQTQTSQYRFFSQVALRVAFWHKRLCQALVEKKQ